jgi:predicted enzyme related to lactoylglutathione lyase
MTSPTAASRAGTPIWIDLASSDPAASRDFYGRVFGWLVEVNPDPQYGGYALATIGGKSVAGIGPRMMAEAPTAWSLYLGTTDADGLASRVAAAGGTVVVPPMTVGGQGRMLVFQDPAGAFIGAWEAAAMSGFELDGPNTFAWAELNARGFEAASDFYRDVFGWSPAEIPMGDGQPPYVRFSLGDAMVAGGMEMNAGVPAFVPSYWMVYFGVADVEATFRAAIAAGATEMMPPTPFPGGQFAILSDPQGATFAIRSAG